MSHRSSDTIYDFRIGLLEMIDKSVPLSNVWNNPILPFVTHNNGGTLSPTLSKMRRADNVFANVTVTQMAVSDTDGCQ